jgi:large subunit ribosomal protein L10
MPMTRPEKEKQVEDLRDFFGRAVASVLVDFRGVKVGTDTMLRHRFREAGVEYRVVKNNLVRQALQGTSLENNEKLQNQLIGPTAIAWTFEDPSAAAKIIKEFRKERDLQNKLQVKGGLMNEEFLDAQRVEGELATLPGKDELRSQLLAQLMAPAENLVRQIHAPGQNLAYALDARKRQQEGGE